MNTRYVVRLAFALAIDFAAFSILQMLGASEVLAAFSIIVVSLNGLRIKAGDF